MRRILIIGRNGFILFFILFLFAMNARPVTAAGNDASISLDTVSEPALFQPSILQAVESEKEAIQLIKVRLFDAREQARNLAIELNTLQFHLSAKGNLLLQSDVGTTDLKKARTIHKNLLETIDQRLKEIIAVRDEISDMLQQTEEQFSLNEKQLSGIQTESADSGQTQMLVESLQRLIRLQAERLGLLETIFEINGIWGEVRKINVRSTLVQTYDNASLIIPNSQLISNQVTNWSFKDARVRRKINIGVAYGSDIQLVRKTLLEIAGRLHHVLKYPAPQVLFSDFGDSALIFQLRVWTDVDNMFTTETDTRFEIDRLFRDLNIQIPFSQRDLHFKSKIDDSSVNPDTDIDYGSNLGTKGRPV